MKSTIIDKIRLLKINGTSIPWKIFQIKSLELNYKSFSDIRIALGLDTFERGGFLNKADEVQLHKKNLLKSYILLFPKYSSELKFLKLIFQFQIVISVFFIGYCYSYDNALMPSIVIFPLLILSFLALKFKEQKPGELYNLSLKDEAIFCYLYIKEAIYIEKAISGLDTIFENISIQESDCNSFLYEPTIISENELIPFLNKNKWGFIKQGELYIDYQFDCDQDGQFYDLRFSKIEELALVNKGGLYGYINKSGKAIIDFQYKKGNRFNNGFAIVCDLNNKYGVIDFTNKTVIKFKYESIFHFNEDLYLVELKGKFGLVNSKNEIILKIIYSEIGELVSDRATIELKVDKTTEKYGYIDSSGNIVIETKFKFAFNFIHDFAVVEQFNKFDSMSDDEWMKELDSDDFYYNFFESENSGGYGLINKTGDIIVPFIYDEINFYETMNFNSEGFLVTACKNEEWGIIYMGSRNIFSNELNKKLQLTKEFKFKYLDEDDILNQLDQHVKILDFEILKPVRKNNKYGFEDLNQELIIEYQFDNYYPFENGLCRVEKNSKFGIINLKGDVLVDFIYDDIWFLNDSISVTRNQFFFYLDPEGKELAIL